MTDAREPEAPELEVLFDAATIARRVGELADELATAVDPGRVLPVVALLDGAMVLAADLGRALSDRGLALRVEFLRLSSYGAGTESSGSVRLALDLEQDLPPGEVLLVDDILDSGRTLAFARDHLLARGASSVRTLVLLDKPSRRAVDVTADHVGFVIPDRFVVGYGIDHAGRHRALPCVAAIS